MMFVSMSSVDVDRKELGDAFVEMKTIEDIRVFYNELYIIQPNGRGCWKA